MNSEITDLPSRLNWYLPIALQYACRYWASHLIKSTELDSAIALLANFCNHGLHFWIKVCSLLGILRDALISLEAVQCMFVQLSASSFIYSKAMCLTLYFKQNHNVRNTSNITKILDDCKRFIREFFPILSTSAGQVYDSALLFAPSQSILCILHSIEMPQITAHNASEPSWGACLRTMYGHSSCVTSVVFSADGTRIISGSLDHSVQVWDAVSGAHLNTFEGHTNSVCSMSISGDGKQIASGSMDGKIVLWDVSSGAHTVTLKGHKSSVISAEFSPDGKCIVSGADDGTILVWGVNSGAHLCTLDGSSKRVYSVAVLPDSKQIVSGLHDQTIGMWNVDSGMCVGTIEGHTGIVRAIAFLSNSTLIASGLDNETVCLWDAMSCGHIHTLKGHTMSISSVAFSIVLHLAFRRTSENSSD